MPKPIPDNLREVYECLIDCVLYARPFEDIQPHIGNDVMLFGTARHEKITNHRELLAMFTKQNKELESVSLKINRSGIIFEKFFAEGKGCILVEELDFIFIDLNHSMHLRLSAIFELINNAWVCWHFHASTPDSNIDESESIPVQGLMKKNRQLEESILTRTEELRLSLESLKNTQSQLIQSEKMASLGELTAGIAHEIQNPLNFVNNFSEVSNELIKEIQDIRLKTQDTDNKTEEDELLRDISQNLEKINHHGKRADAIVKGMLQHSRTSSGQKELTDINALCDEYLRLSYHGYRAKDKSFNAKFEMDFDSSLPKINVIPQDIGRVVLNLINNAFYVVNERAKNQQPTTNNEPYVPTVTVSTKNIGDKVEIKVKDNGKGIPDSIKEKIFQPFFTTKPTGQGTGLGLSLSYDIVKAHGGELRVETKETDGSEFIILLPFN